MDKHTATELAYKNGYRAGQKAAIDKIFGDLETEIKNHNIYWSFQSWTNLLDRLSKFKETYEVK